VPEPDAWRHAGSPEITPSPSAEPLSGTNSLNTASSETDTQTSLGLNSEATKIVLATPERSPRRKKSVSTKQVITVPAPARPAAVAPKTRPTDPSAMADQTLLPSAPTQMTGTFAGKGWQIFGLAFFTGTLTLMTFGIYRFWRRTHLRRWYWASMRIDGLPLEYTGNAGEKILGFFIAVVILAFYLGVINVGLTFFSVVYLNGLQPAHLLSLLGILPIWFYAKYRARRYVLSRTRWRGIRFGQSQGAWAYALRAIFYWCLTLLSFGLLWPLMTYRLEEFKTNRMWFGDASFRQGGAWWHLYAAYWPIPTVLMIVAMARFGEYAPDALRTAIDQTLLPELTRAQADMIAGITLVTAAFALALFFAIYRISTFIRLTRTKQLGDSPLGLSLRTRRMLGILIWGGIKAILLTAILLGGVLIGGLAAASAIGVELQSYNPQNDATPMLDPAILGMWQVQIALVGIYLVGLLFWAVARETFVTYPLLRACTEAFSVLDPPSLTRISQRGKDRVGQAEGFADALDVGAVL
jgi:uncharacterized membrane protein YjgN (DUF898 family)